MLRAVVPTDTFLFTTQVSGAVFTNLDYRTSLVGFVDRSRFIDTLDSLAAHSPECRRVAHFYHSVFLSGIQRQQREGSSLET